MINAIRELVAIPSITAADPEPDKPFGNEVYRALHYCLDLCGSFGFRTKNLNNYIGYGEIGQGKELIGILCHLDVVPPGNGWSMHPFEGKMCDNRIFGRGVQDDKGPAMAAVYAMKDLLDSGIPLNKRIRIIFGCQEETGKWTDIGYYLKREEIPDYGFTPDADFPVIYGEMGIAVIDLLFPLSSSGILMIEGGTAPNMVPDFAKSIAIDADGNPVNFESQGLSAHASLLWKGENAISRLMDQMYQNCGDSCDIARFYHEKIGFDIHGEKMNCSLEDKESGKLLLNVGRIQTEKKNPYLFRYSLSDIFQRGRSFGTYRICCERLECGSTTC